MAVTMTLHNLPEGFAVAFAAFTDFGPIMAAAIAFHNIPEVGPCRSQAAAVQHRSIQAFQHICPVACNGGVLASICVVVSAVHLAGRDCCGPHVRGHG